MSGLIPTPVRVNGMVMTMMLDEQTREEYAAQGRLVAATAIADSHVAADVTTPGNPEVKARARKAKPAK